MMQTVAVIVIILLAAAAMCYRLYRLFRPGRSAAGCSPDQCASCANNVHAHCDRAIKQ